LERAELSLIMKTIRLILAAAVLLTSAVSAQQFRIDWHTIDGGGGTSTGGVFTVSGTIGQPDAGGPMTGGQYSVTGGFWALPIAVQTPGTPILTIARAAPGFAQISWSPATPGFALQQSDNLTTPNWSDAPSGAANPATVPATLPSKFYRLHKP
jgi:hypothetical protein